MSILVMLMVVVMFVDGIGMLYRFLFGDTNLLVIFTRMTLLILLVGFMLVVKLIGWMLRFCECFGFWVLSTWVGFSGM